MLIGERIRELRQRREITQQELADALGCSRPAVVLWENGARQTPLYQLRKISKILQCSLSELLGESRPGDGEMITEHNERVLVETYRQMDKILREKYLDLMAASVDRGEKRKLGSNFSQGRRVAHSNTIEHAS